MRAVSLLSITALLSTGCYYRTTFGQNPPPAGAPVRVTLTRSATSLLTLKIGDQVRTVDGRAVSSSRDSLTIAVSKVVRLDDSAVVWNGELVTLSRWDIVSVEHRHFSAPVTALIAGGVVMVAFMAAKEFKKPVKGQ